MHFHVAAYAIHPSAAALDERREAEFLAGLRALPFVAGLEVPHLSGFDRWDEDFLFRHADPEWTYVATDLPGLSASLRESPGFGLSAVDDASRRAAINAAAALRDSLRRAHDRLGRRAIIAAELQSGCAGGRLNGTATTERLAASLAEIGAWDWDGAEIVVEHCDAALPGQAFQKGFLTIEEEIAAVRAANRRVDRPVGVSLNWGRSAIEGRGRDAPARHAALALSAGLLRGMIFSGASGRDGPFGGWQDLHIPPARAPYTTKFGEGSLLTEDDMRVFFAQTRTTALRFAGLKIGIRPLDAPVAQRLALVRDSLLTMASAALA